MTTPNTPSPHVGLRTSHALLALASLCLLLVVAVCMLSSGSSHDSASTSRDPRDQSLAHLYTDADADLLDSVTVYPDVDQVAALYKDAHRAGGDKVILDVPEQYLSTFVGRMVSAGVTLHNGTGTPEADPVPHAGEHPVARRTTAQRIGMWVLAAALTGLGILGIAWLVTLRGRSEAAAAAAEAVGNEPRKAKSGGGGDSTVEVVAPGTISTRFSDVAGADEAVAELREMAEFLKDPARFTRLGAKPPRGAVLSGPPGTGKTLLARALAGEVGDAAFLPCTGSDFVEMYVGVGAKRIRALFEKARSFDAAVIFIDEIDAVGRRRTSSETGSSAETENTLNALLSELDGFKDRGNILVIAATNRPELLDEAVTRSGRLERKVVVPNPDPRGRAQILQVHAAGRPLAGDVDLETIARRTPGFSGAQLAAVVNEACMQAARDGLDEVTGRCLDDAVATVAMGRARVSALVTDHDRLVTAWHEGGHTLAAYLIPEADDPVQVTIVPRGPAGGVTWMSGSDDIFLTRRKAHAQLVVALGGRAGEELLLDGEYTQGASGDLQSATQTATAMVTQYGMTELGYAVREPRAGTPEVTDAVSALLHDAHERALALLGENREFLAAVVDELLIHDTLDLADIDRIAGRCGVVRGKSVDLPAVPVAKRPSSGEPAPAVDAVAAAVSSPARRRPRLVAAMTSWRRRSPGEEPEPALA